MTLEDGQAQPQTCHKARAAEILWVGIYREEDIQTGGYTNSRVYKQDPTPSYPRPGMTDGVWTAMESTGWAEKPCWRAACSVDSLSCVLVVCACLVLHRVLALLLFKQLFRILSSGLSQLDPAGKGVMFGVGEWGRSATS